MTFTCFYQEPLSTPNEKRLEAATVITKPHSRNAETFQLQINNFVSVMIMVKQKCYPHLYKLFSKGMHYGFNRLTILRHSLCGAKVVPLIMILLFSIIINGSTYFALFVFFPKAQLIIRKYANSAHKIVVYTRIARYEHKFIAGTYLDQKLSVFFQVKGDYPFPDNNLQLL